MCDAPVTSHISVLMQCFPRVRATCELIVCLPLFRGTKHVNVSETHLSSNI